jgi:hypothetical protein
MSKDQTDSVNIFKIAYNKLQSSIVVELNWFLILGFVGITVCLYIFRNFFKDKLSELLAGETTFDIDIGFFKVSQKIKRNFQNLYIANRVYIELVTRKAALKIDPEYDVIKEIYDSWYKVFDIIRCEIKNVPGEFLVNQNSKELIDLTIKILNDGMRPHLTEYQARFRSWYTLALSKEEFKGMTPQQIQKEYPDYGELVTSLSDVNLLLITFTEKLQFFINKK